MTLVEVLIALVILGMVSVAALATIRLGQHSWDRAARISMNTSRLATTESLLRAVLSNAYPAFRSPELRDRRIAFAGTPDAVTWIAPLPELIPDEAWAELRLYVARDGIDNALLLDWRLDLPESTGLSRPFHTHRLQSDISAIQLAYFGPTAPGQTSVWQDRWIDRDTLPSLIRMRIWRPSGGKFPWLEIVVATRVTATTACVYDAVDPMCRKVP
jgi:general secretion pathway protein J